MVLVVSLLAVLVVAALVGRTCARARPGTVPARPARSVQLPDAGTAPLRPGPPRNTPRRP